MYDYGSSAVDHRFLIIYRFAFSAFFCFGRFIRIACIVLPVIRSGSERILVCPVRIRRSRRISRFSSQFEPPGRFLEVLCHAQSLGVHVAQGVLGVGQSLLCRQPVPHRGFDVVLRYAQSRHAGEARAGGRIPQFPFRSHRVQRSQVELCFCKALIRGKPVPPGCFVVAMEHALAFGKQGPQEVLSVGEPLFGGREIPSGGIREALRHAMARGIHGTQDKLGARQALIGRFTVPLCRFNLVRGHAKTEVVHESVVHLRHGMAPFGRSATGGHQGGCFIRRQMTQRLGPCEILRARSEHRVQAGLSGLGRLIERCELCGLSGMNSLSGLWRLNGLNGLSGLWQLNGLCVLS